MSNYTIEYISTMFQTSEDEEFKKKYGLPKGKVEELRNRFNFIECYTNKMGVYLEVACYQIDKLEKPDFIDGYDIEYDEGGPWPDGSFDEPFIRFVSIYNEKMEFSGLKDYTERFHTKLGDYQDPAREILSNALRRYGSDMWVMTDTKKNNKGE